MSCATLRAFVIGTGSVGTRLLAALDRAALPALGVRRGAWPAGTADPAHPALRIVAVREEDLAGALDALGAVPRERCVLVQNGFLEAVLGDLGPVTRGLVWFTAKGDFFHELQPSLVHGPHAAALCAALARGGLAVREVHGAAEFRREMVIKGLWNAVVGLPLAVHGLRLDEYLATCEGEWRALLDEGACAASADCGVDVTGEEVAARIAATAGAIGHTRGGTKALAFRNGALAAMGRRHGIPTPVNDRLLAAVENRP